MHSLAPVYCWEPPGRDITVHLSLDVIIRLGAAVSAVQPSDEGRAEEIGGLLLGLAQPGEPRLTVVEDFEPLPSEHLRGPSFTLSTSDRKTLEQRLRRGAIRGLSVVGYYRSHTRPGLYLDQDDFAVVDGSFAHPSQVVLLVRPSPAGSSAGLFFWEDGDMRRQASYLEFPFDQAKLLSGNHRVLKRSEQWLPAEPEPEPQAAPLALPGWLRGIRLPRQPRVLLLLLVAAVFVAASYLAVRKPVSPSSSATAEGARSALALRVERSGEAFRISWDRNSPLVRGAASAALHIRDVAGDYRLELPPRQLASGSVMYFPTGSDVSFELQVSGAKGAASEIVRTFTPIPPVPKLAGVPDLGADLPLLPPPLEERSRRQVAHREAPEKTARRFVPVPARTQSASALLPPPPRVGAAPASGVLAVPLSRGLQQEATVAMGPAQPVTSRLRRIPVLLRLQRPPEGFVPPRPVKQIKPVIPAGLTASGPLMLDLKLKVDESGDVVTTEVLRDNAPAPVSRSVQAAAREWRFAPALINGKAVASQTVLRFRFER